jgi:hypothetical protein
MVNSAIVEGRPTVSSPVPESRSGDPGTPVGWVPAQPAPVVVVVVVR